MAEVKKPVATSSVGGRRFAVAGSAARWRVRTTRQGSAALAR